MYNDLNAKGYYNELYCKASYSRSSLLEEHL